MRTRRLIFTPTAVLSVLIGLMTFASVPAQATGGRSETGRFGPLGRGSGDFEEPQSITVDQATGDIYVYEVGESATGEEGNIYKFNAEGEPAEFSSSGSNVIEGVGGVAREVQIAVDSSSGPAAGDIYIATGEAVKVYSAAGVELTTLASGEEPTGVAVAPNGDVYVAFLEAEAIRKYVPTANPVSEADLAGELQEVEDIENVAADSAGDVYAAKFSGGVIKYDASQFSTGQEAVGTTIAPEGHTLAVDTVSGNLYVNTGREISEYTSSGTLVESFGSLGSSYGAAVYDESGEVYAPEEKVEAEVIIFGPASPPPVTEFPLEIKKAGTGMGTVTSEPPGIDCGLTCEAKYGEGAEVELKETPEPGSTFAGWSGGGCSGTSTTCTVELTTAMMVTATFNTNTKPKFLLKVDKDGAGTGMVTSAPSGIDCGVTCEAEYEEGAKVELKESSEPGSTFAGWSGGGCSGTSTTCTVELTAAKTITATFEPSTGAEYRLIIVKDGQGTVASAPSGIDCGTECSHAFSDGEKITLTETAEPGYEFLGWIGCGSSGATCEFEVTKEVEVTAIFAKTARGERGEKGTQGAKGEKGEMGEPGINGTNGGRGLEGPPGEAGPAGAQGEKGPAGAPGANGTNGAQGPAGPAGARGPAGPAGQVELVTCRTVKKDGKKAQDCTTKLVSGTVKFTTGDASTDATLSRHGHVYAAGTARAGARGRMSLRLTPVRKLRPGNYTLTLIGGAGRYETIRREVFTLR